MRVSTEKFRRRFLCLFISGVNFLAGTFAGCGGSENKFDMSPETKKAVLTSKVGDPSKFIKPGKSPVGKPR
jgi:hypothetical protein